MKISQCIKVEGKIPSKVEGKRPNFKKNAVQVFYRTSFYSSLPKLTRIPIFLKRHISV